jgi:hypothetical protein
MALAARELQMPLIERSESYGADELFLSAVRGRAPQPRAWCKPVYPEGAKVGRGEKPTPAP